MKAKSELGQWGWGASGFASRLCAGRQCRWGPVTEHALQVPHVETAGYSSSKHGWLVTELNELIDTKLFEQFWHIVNAVISHHYFNYLQSWGLRVLDSGRQYGHIPYVLQLQQSLLVLLQGSEYPLDHLKFMIKENVITERWKACMANWKTRFLKRDMVFSLGSL